MATLKDINDVITGIDFRITLFGATAKGKRKFLSAIKAARDAIMEEQGLDNPDKAVALSEDTVLGKKAKAALEALEALFPPKK